MARARPARHSRWPRKNLKPRTVWYSFLFKPSHHESRASLGHVGHPPHLAPLLVMHLGLGQGGVPGVEEAKHYHLGGVRKQ